NEAMRTPHKDDTLQRRQFIQRCVASAFSLSILPGAAVASTSSAAAGAENPGQGFGKAKHVIFIMLKGGLTQVDTFDPKEPGGSPFKTIRNSADGEFTSAIPKMAAIADRMCVIRSMTGKIGIHGSAQYFMRTAYTERGTVKHPMIGAYANAILGPSHDVMPSTVTVNRGAGFGNGFLPTSMGPLPILEPAKGLQDVKAPKGMDHLKKRLSILDQLDHKFREAKPDKYVKAYNEFYEEAVRLMDGQDVKAFDLALESKQMRDAYGNSRLGQGCLLARRLVESGVRFIEVESSGWDMHAGLEHAMAEKAPPLDQAVSQLILDLEQRGLLGETLVVLTTEFGRNPREGGGGRGHFPSAWSVALAGAGVKAGSIFGATANDGAGVTENPVTTGQLHSTIGWALGIQPKHEVMSPSRRPFSIGNEAQPILGAMA
ncbi:MAG: DUF1501 domain-containing protein, partial [Verrucomicrobiota bacterium]